MFGARSLLLIGAFVSTGHAQCPPLLVFAPAEVSSGLLATHSAPTFNSEVWAMSGGCAAGDFDRDGDQDLFWLGGGNTPDKLFINNGDGTFTDHAAAWGVGASHLGVGAAVADFDGDGWLDIYVTSHSADETSMSVGPGHHRLYRNNGDGTFSDVAAQAGVAFTSPTVADGWGAAFGDYDLDGDLDLAVAGWKAGADGNRLFRNNGDGTFTDVTSVAFRTYASANGRTSAPARLGADPAHEATGDGTVPFDFSDTFGFTPRFCDMDGDRYPELLWASDFGTSRYFINARNGTFIDATESSGVGLESNGMGSAIADVDGDGLFDWYVSSIDFSQDAQPRPPLDGNMLYLNQGGHVFRESSDSLGVSAGWWGWGVAAADLDHDGRVDLVETNGWHYAPWVSQPARVWRRVGASFQEEAAVCNLIHTGNGRGLVLFDFDNDGDLDIVISSVNGDLRLYRNDLSGSCTGWLRVFLDTGCTSAVPPDGVGCVVVVRIGGVEQRQVIQAGPTFLAQSELSAHFGVGSASVLDEVRVEWTDGTVTTLADVNADQTMTIGYPCAAQASVGGLSEFVLAWLGGDVSADLTTSGSGGGDPDYGRPDGRVTGADLLFAINRAR